MDFPKSCEAQGVDDTEGIEMKRKYDLAIFIGRFQPLHNGHVHNIEKGLEIADNVLVILGSKTDLSTLPMLRSLSSDTRRTVQATTSKCSLLGTIPRFPKPLSTTAK